MSPKITELRGRATGIARHPRTRKIAIWLVAIVWRLESLPASSRLPCCEASSRASCLTNSTGQVSIEQIRINPFAMSLTVRGFLMKERQGSATAVSFEELHANLELAIAISLGTRV